MGTLQITPETRVGEVVAHYPATMRMCEALGIDYCCGGKLTLDEAAAKAGLPVATVVTVLQTAAAQAAQQGEAQDWHALPLEKLITHIVDTHHVYLANALPRLQGLLAKVARAHGEKHSDVLQPLVTIFDELKSELEAHLRKEEEVTFPAIRRMLNGTWDETVARTIAELESEHEAAGAALEAMHRVTHDFALPADACTTFAAAYEGLQALEGDLHQHIHKENNVLFPRVREYAARMNAA